jgi:protein-L-isoaspartate(D-aspartate) O-methyltransferase
MLPERYRLDMRRTIFMLLSCLVLAAACAPAQTVANDSRPRLDDFKAMRKQLIASIRKQTRNTGDVTGVREIDARILDVMAAVPRHEFVPRSLRLLSYLDMPLPLGHEQSISQPFLIALMSHLAEIRKSDIVFETGTGAGYQAAILSKLCKRVYSMEVIPPLAEAAADRLKRLGYANVEVKTGDGFYGWAGKGPFDAIIVKEAVHYIPPPLLNQLKPGGRMVVPVGPLNGSQILKLVTKDEAGRLHHRDILPVRFSPLQGGERI